MSVLNDIIVQNGEWIRNISAELSSSGAEEFMVMTKKFPHIRMMRIEYAVSCSHVPGSVIDTVNHYWQNEEGDLMWGLPGGSYDDFVDRLISYQGDWSGGCWLPNLKRLTNEARARDLLLATYLFPFKMYDKHADPAMTTAVLECLKRIDSRKVVTGSNVLSDMILSVGRGDGLFSDMSELMADNPVEILKQSKDFNQWSTYFAMSTGVNANDADAAAAGLDKLDWDRQHDGAKFIAISELANHCTRAKALCSRRGRIGKNIRSMHDRIRSGGNFDEWEIDQMKSTSTNDLMSRVSSSGRSMAYRIKKAPNIRILAAGDLALVYSHSADKLYVITGEQIKAMKFVSMTHAMWHFHASTLCLEYSTSPGMVAPPETDDGMKSAIGQISKVFTDIGEITGLDVDTSLRQVVVPLSTVQDKLSDLWNFYIRTMAFATGSGIVDYLGRYLHELFELYTAKIGGHLATEGLSVQMEEFADTYRPLGFAPEEDYEAFCSLLLDLPMSCAQDFGRLSKIVLPYEVDPIYSFIHRVKAMHKPNPIGRAEFIDDYRFNVADHTPEENSLRKLTFLAGSRVMIAMADMRESAIQVMSAEAIERAGGANAAWHDILSELKSSELALTCNFSVRELSDMDLPEADKRSARAAALSMVRGHKMPTNPLAGAYLDVSNIFSYAERTDPDLAYIKPTALPSSNPAVVFSNLSGVPRSGPTRDNSGLKQRGTGNMVLNYLADLLPTRPESLAFFGSCAALATTSDKIETNKYPLKTRIITALCAEARRMMSEYEHNNGRALRKVPGFTMGADPAEVRRCMYAAMRADLLPDETVLYISLDLSSWSTGMHWDIQTWCNQALAECFDGAEDVMRIIEACTKGSMMVRSEKDMRLFSMNDGGANYEGVDGKRNTFMHCVLWYLSRCEAYSLGINGTMRALLFIDDGCASIRVKKDALHETASVLRKSMVKVYVRYGFKLSMLKSVVSETYAQFLNEIYMHGVHIGYGFRALCHTGAQTFPKMATIAEEMAVITGGIRGAAVSGGNPVRLLAGLHFLMQLYMRGVIGNKGSSIRTANGFTSALILAIPTFAGGFGTPSYTQLFSNLAGHREPEKLAKVSMIMRCLRRMGAPPAVIESVSGYMRGKLSMIATVSRSNPPDRIGVSHPASTQIGAHDRSIVIATAARSAASNYQAEKLLSAYIAGADRANTFANAFIEATAAHTGKLPIALLDKALATDANKAMGNLVEKIASSSLVDKLLPAYEVSRYNRRYARDGRNLVEEFMDALHI